MKRILFPSDFSAAAEAAFETLLILAKTFAASVVLLHDYALLDSARLDDEILAAGSLQAMEAKLRLRGEQQLARLEQRLAAAGIAHESVLVRGNSGQLIVETAERLNCDLILMGSRGLNADDSLMLGSTSTCVLHISPIPVMILPQRQKPRKDL